LNYGLIRIWFLIPVIKIIDSKITQYKPRIRGVF